MKIAITGSTGQLGTSINSHLSNHEIVNINENFYDKKQLEEKIINTNYDVLINCVAFHDLYKSENEKKKAFEINTNCVALLSKLSGLKKSHFIHFSSDYVFDGENNKPYIEESETNPINYYGVTKLKGEEAAIENNENTTVFRVASLFGIRRNNSSLNFVEKIINSSRENKIMKIVDDQIMSPTSTENIGKLIEKIIYDLKNFKGIYHLTNDGQASWYEFTKRIFKTLKLENEIIPIKYNELKTDIKRPLFSVLNNSKIKNNTNYVINNWEEDLEEYLLNYK
jgi:dTDP-4-dehydrorhamnose reductase